MSKTDFGTNEKTDHVDHSPVNAALQTASDHNRITKTLIACSCVSYLLAFNYGFSAALIGATLQQPEFYAYFPILTGSNAANLIGAVVCMTNAGGTLGIAINSVVGDKYGRKVAFLVAAFFTLLGTGLSAGSTSYGMLIAGRAIQLVGGWGGVVSAISYVQELAPTFARGEFGSGIGPSINSGYFAASWIQVGFFYWNDPINWRIPQVFAAIPPLAIIAMCFWIPESPRWLIFNGQKDKALEVFKKLHRDEIKDPDFVLARAEHFQVVKQVALDKTLQSSWLGMFGPKYRRRTLAAMLVCFVNQMSGPQVITNYGPSIYASAGLTGGTPLIVAGAWYICCVVFAAFWARFVDRIGRRNLINGGVLGTLLSFSLLTALYAVYVDRSTSASNIEAGQRALIFTFFLYIFWYQMGEPAMFLYIGEIFGSHVRNKGIALGLSSITITSAWLTMAFPVGVAAGGWKFYLLLIFTMFFGLIGQWFLLRETRGVSLEEMPEVWGDTEDVAIHAKDIDLAKLEAEEAVQRGV